MPLRLTQAAFDLFSRYGIDEVTIDRIAAQAGVTKGSFYSHFTSKRDIILAACSYYYRRYLQAVQQEAATRSDPAERLRSVLAYSVKECVANRQNRVFTTEIMTLSQKDEAFRRSWAQFYDAVREFYVGIVVAGKEAGVFDVADPRLAVDVMLAAMEGIKLRAGFEAYLADDDEQARLVESLFRICAGKAVSVMT
ncbi:MAG: TetR/AcrR family transcriptional regulator [Planctomycetota bacterium]|nr:MAG: TetR/AcrR family transcriptional regulator [Planctomycetota bacterium]